MLLHDGIMNRQILPKTVGYCYCKILQYLTICRLANLPACFSFETMQQYQTFLNRNIIAGWLATTVYFWHEHNLSCNMAALTGCRYRKPATRQIGRKQGWLTWATIQGKCCLQRRRSCQSSVGTSACGHSWVRSSLTRCWIILVKIVTRWRNFWV